MAQWEEMLSGAAGELAGHLTLERVRVSEDGSRMEVRFASNILVEERPFRAIRSALRRYFDPIQVSLIIRCPALGDAFLTNPQNYLDFIQRCVHRKYPACTPFLQSATLECNGNLLTVLVTNPTAPAYMENMGIDRYIESLKQETLE